MGGRGAKPKNKAGVRKKEYVSRNPLKYIKTQINEQKTHLFGYFFNLITFSLNLMKMLLQFFLIINKNKKLLSYNI